MSHQDRIFIEGLAVSARIGITEQERASAQKLSVDIDAFMPLETAGRADDFAATVDYAALAGEIRLLAEERTFKLIEAFAQAGAEIVLRHPSVQRVRICVRKFVLEKAESVGVEIWRSRV